MARIFVTGSSTGLGLLAGQELSRLGHQVILHGRNPARAEEARRALPAAEAVVVGDLSTISATKDVAAQVNRIGRCDAVIHNAAIGYQERSRIETADRLPALFAANTLAPYILTALIERPARLVYLSSGLHQSAAANLDDLTWVRRGWQGSTAYSESKLHDAMLAFAVARRWPDVQSNAVEPGWVPTRMGGASAPDDLQEGCRTQAWLAVSDEAEARVTGQYFFHKRRRKPNPQAQDEHLQERLIAECAGLSGVEFPD